MKVLTHTSPEAMVDKLASNYFKAMCLGKGGKIGFSHHLKVSYNTIDKNRITVGPDSMTYRYKLSETIPRFSVGLLTALMDELSSSVFYRVGNPGTPGLSVQMQTALLADKKTLDGMDEIDIVNIATKMGKRVSFTRTEYRDVSTSSLLGYSSHVKFMNLGNWWADKYFTNPFLHNLANRLYIDHCTIPSFDHRPLFEETLQSHLKFSSPDKATFVVTPDHINPMGALHGGCHAMIMEQMAETFAKEKLQSDSVMVESMHLENIRSGKGQLDVVCEALGPIRNDSLDVRVVLKNGNKISSEGNLTVSAVRDNIQQSKL